MESDLVLLNGDTLFEQRVLMRLLDSPDAPVMMTISRKSSYDADDMKVRCEDGKLCAVGKTLPLTETTGESIGMLLFRAKGPGIFRDALDAAMREEGASRRWYLSVIDGLGKRGLVSTVSVEDLEWAEIDFPQDLERAAQLVTNWGPIRPATPISG
jgi:choline kinase